jgi:hypothetical protein
MTDPRDHQRFQSGNVIRSRCIGPLAQVMHRRLYPARFRQAQHLPHVRSNPTQQFQRGPSPALDRKSHHVRHAGQQFDAHGISPRRPKKHIHPFGGICNINH